MLQRLAVPGRFSDAALRRALSAQDGPLPFHLRRHLPGSLHESQEQMQQSGQMGGLAALGGFGGAGAGGMMHGGGHGARETHDAMIRRGRGASLRAEVLGAMRLWLADQLPLLRALLAHDTSQNALVASSATFAAAAAAGRAAAGTPGNAGGGFGDLSTVAPSPSTTFGANSNTMEDAAAAARDYDALLPDPVGTLRHMEAHWLCFLGSAERAMAAELCAVGLVRPACPVRGSPLLLSAALPAPPVLLAPAPVHGEVSTTIHVAHVAHITHAAHPAHPVHAVHAGSHATHTVHTVVRAIHAVHAIHTADARYG